MKPSEYTASLHFKQLLTLQTHHPLPQTQLLLQCLSTLEVDTLLLEEAAFYYLGSYPLDFRFPLPTIYLGCEPQRTSDVSSIPRWGSHRTHTHTHTRSSAARQPVLPRTVTHRLQVGWFASLTPTSEIPSFTPPSHPLLTPAAIPQGAPAERSGQDHQASCPHSYTFYNFYPGLFLIFSSTRDTHYLPLHFLLSIPRKLSAYAQKAATLSLFRSLLKGHVYKSSSTSFSLQWPALAISLYCLYLNCRPSALLLIPDFVTFSLTHICYTTHRVLFQIRLQDI